MMSQQSKLKLVDHLALDRTYMANERTLLAYARSAFAIFIAGVSFLKLFENEPLLTLTGWTFLGVAPLIFIFGLLRSWQMQRQISKHYRSVF